MRPKARSHVRVQCTTKRFTVTTQPVSKLRLRFTLKWFLLACAGMSVVLGIYLKRTSDQRRVVHLVTTIAPDATDSLIEYDYQFDSDGMPIQNATSSVPDSLLNTFGVSSFHSIVGVNLDGERVRLSDIQSLASLRNLRRLDLEYNAVDDAALDTISKLVTLERLDMQETHVSDDDLRCLKTLNRLRWFMVSGKQITDQSMLHLANATQLESMSFRSTSVDGSGLRALNCSESLRTLDLRDSPVGDDAIPAILEFENLEKLNLSGATLSDAALLRIAELSHLKSFTAPRTISRATRHSLKKAMPNSEVKAR